VRLENDWAAAERNIYIGLVRIRHCKLRVAKNDGIVYFFFEHVSSYCGERPPIL